MITILALLFLVTVIFGVLALRPKSFRLKKVIWWLLIAGSLSFLAAAIVFPYTITLSDEGTQVSTYFMWASIGGAALGFISVVSSLIIAIVSRVKKL